MDQPKDKEDTTDQELRYRTKTIFCVNAPKFLPGQGKFVQKPGASGSSGRLVVTYEPKEEGDIWGEHSVYPQPWQGKWKHVDDNIIEVTEFMEKKDK